jgi:hypothetical protein
LRQATPNQEIQYLALGRCGIHLRPPPCRYPMITPFVAHAQEPRYRPTITRPPRRSGLDRAV